MIVVLDTTVFSSDFMFSGTAWRVLAHASKAWTLQIRVPEVVVAEAIGGYGREIEKASLAIDKIVKAQAGRLGVRRHFEDLSSRLQEQLDGYPERLTEMIEELGGSVLPPPDISHMDLVWRAVLRRKPCDHKGDGYRDSLNWLLILDIARNNPGETVFWVTGNTDDFANAEKVGLHEDLLEDLREAGAVDRVRWSSDLSSLLLSLAVDHYDESADDLRKVQDGLQQGAIAEFISTAVLPGVVKSVISPRRCGLPLGSVNPQILAVQGEPDDLEIDVKGVAEKRGAFAEFSFAAEALIGLDLNTIGELPEGFESGEGVDRTATIVKPLKFRGLIELDLYGRPVSGEVANIDALGGDPGLDLWKPLRLSTALGRHKLIDPALIAALQEAIRPKFDSKHFGLLADPNFREMLRPKIDPNLLAGLLSSFNPLAGISYPSVLAGAPPRSVKQADLDDDDDAEEDGADDEGNEDQPDA